MKRSNCNPQFGGIRPVVWVSLAVLIALGILLLRHWAPHRVVERRHAALIAAIERRSAKRLDRLLAESYRDQWDFDRAQASLALSDIGSQFLSLSVTPVGLRIEAGEPGAFVVRHRVEVRGQGSPLAHEMARLANRLETPFEFHWRRQSRWPGDWKLARILQPDLPADLHGYEPGDLRKALGGDPP